MNWVLLRNDTSEQVTFPQDFSWSDEYTFKTIAQKAEYSLSGALVVQQGKKLAGRVITLTGDWVWHKKEVADTLLEWTQITELQMTLTHYNGKQYQVIFRHSDGALEANPVLYRTPETPEDQYTITIRLLEVV